MKQSIQSFLVFVVTVIVIHLLYVGLVVPMADQASMIAQQNGESVSRSLWVILRDGEQEVCIILMVYGIYLMASRMFALFSDNYIFGFDLIGALNQQQDTMCDHSMASVLEGLDTLDEKIRDTEVVDILRASISRFLLTKDIATLSETVSTSVEALAVSTEAGNSMIRYLIWAIPSIGFIGTVRGIGVALAKADQALEGNIVGMTSALGVAFNSTLVALFISIILMFMLHGLQRMQDERMVKIQKYCEKAVIDRVSKAGLLAAESQGV